MFNNEFGDAALGNDIHHELPEFAVHIFGHQYFAAATILPSVFGALKLEFIIFNESFNTIEVA
jgi:hypothetical protein